MACLLNIGSKVILARSQVRQFTTYTSLEDRRYSKSGTGGINNPRQLDIGFNPKSSYWKPTFSIAVWCFWSIWHFSASNEAITVRNPNGPLLDDLVLTKTQAEHQMVTEKVQTRLPNVRYKWDHPLYKWGKIENNSSLEERLRSSLIQMRHWSMWPLLLWLWSSRTTTGLCYCETNWLENCWKYMIKILKWVLQFANVETSQTERARGKCPELR